MHPDDLLSAQFRLMPQQRGALKKLGIETVRHLLYHFPTRYDQAGDESAITGLVPGAHTTIFGTIHKLDTRRSWKRRIPVGEGVIRDGTGSIKIMWFHQPYLAKKYAEGMFVKAVGTVGGKENSLYLANPHVEPADPADAGLFAKKGAGEQGALFAVYPESRGVTSLWLRHAIKKIFASGILDTLEDAIPQETLERYHLPDLKTSLLSIHTPEDIRHAQAARKRFAFEEIFLLQLTRQLERRLNDAQPSLQVRDARALAEKFLSSLELKPTGAQRRAIGEILEDLALPHPMARLLEGDVGSGKTLIAAATAYAVVNSRPPERTSGTLQVAYMAPTEILAQQHFQSFIEYFKDLPINIALITGSGCEKFPSKVARGKATDISRAQLLKWVKNGEIAMLVGTHTLIQKSVEFRHLAYAIVDEQHRFGTAQRKALAHKGDAAPHFLSMTATPIPRTLALTMYGDLDISVLDELPPGRATVETLVIQPENRDEAYEAIRRELQKDRQAYVICPRIEEPDPEKFNALQAKSAKAEAKRLQKDVFPDFAIGLLHGSMKAKEKDEAMKKFEKNETQILVATSVVEVGVNVPNATVILIEGAERFGLAQLHQLRGRVQRSSHQPYCYLLAESKGDASRKRLRALEISSDGFKLAEADLEARGSGDLHGKKQWGISDIGMEALRNPRLIEAARASAQEIVTNDPLLADHGTLAVRMQSSSGDLHGE